MNDANQVIGKCPRCRSQIIASLSDYHCANSSCNFSVPAYFWGRHISRRDASTLLRHLKTPPLTGFINGNGQSFKAHLKINRDWQISLMPHGGKTARYKIKKSVPLASAFSTPQKESSLVQGTKDSNNLGLCPQCNSAVIESPRGFYCAGQNCQFAIPPIFHGHQFPRAEVALLLKHHKIGIRTFVNEEGWTFYGTLSISRRGALKLHPTSVPIPPATASSSAPKRSSCPRAMEEGTNLGLCPKCQGEIVEGSSECFCWRPTCQFSIPLKVCGRRLKQSEISALLQHKQTHLLDGFVGERGRPFKAKLAITKAGALKILRRQYQSGTNANFGLGKVRARTKVDSRAPYPKNTVGFLESSNALLDQPGILSWLSRERKGTSLKLPNQLAVVGHGPLSHRELSKLLRSRHISTCAPGTRTASVMVVGRDDWFIDDLEDQIRARQNDNLRVYSQEMLILALASNDDPFDSAGRQTMRAFSETHEALTYLCKSGFEWPEVSAAPLRRLRDFEEYADESPLKAMGYEVGITYGKHQTQRHEILTRAFKNVLRPMISKDYMATWGEPASRQRLRRMARLLAWHAGRHANMVGHETAVSHWQSDLTWLESEFYEPWMRFRWPQTSVD